MTADREGLELNAFLGAKVAELAGEKNAPKGAPKPPYTLEALAKRIDVSKTQLINLRDGTRRAGMDTIRGFARFLFPDSETAMAQLEAAAKEYAKTHPVKPSSASVFVDATVLETLSRYPNADIAAALVLSEAKPEDRPLIQEAIEIVKSRQHDADEDAPARTWVTLIDAELVSVHRKHKDGAVEWAKSEALKADRDALRATENAARLPKFGAKGKKKAADGGRR